MTAYIILLNDFGMVALQMSYHAQGGCEVWLQMDQISKPERLVRGDQQTLVELAAVSF